MSEKEPLGNSIPLKAILVPKDIPDSKVPLQLYLRRVGSQEQWEIVDLTNPAPDKARTYSGTPDPNLLPSGRTRDAIENAWQNFLENTPNPAGQIVASLPAELSEKLGFEGQQRWNGYSNGISGYQQVRQWLSGVGFSAGLGAIALSAAPIPGSRVAAGWLLLTSGVASAGAGALNLADKLEHGNFQWNGETYLDLVDLVGGLAVGTQAGILLRGNAAKVTQLQSAILISESIETGSDIAGGVIISAMHYRRIEEIGQTVSDEKKRKELILNELAKAAATGGLILLGMASPGGGKKGGKAVPETNQTNRNIETELDLNQNNTVNKTLPDENNLTLAPRELIETLPKDLQVEIPISLDSTLNDNTVKVHYKEKNGLIEEIYIVAGKKATANEIKMHIRTVRIMQSYAGLYGRVRRLYRDILEWFDIPNPPGPGTLGFEARLEVEKLSRIILDRLNTIEQLQNSGADLSAIDAYRKEIKDFDAQLKTYEETVAQMNKNPGVGYVAANLSPERLTESLDRLKQKFGTKNSFTEQEIIDLLGWSEQTKKTKQNYLSNLRNNSSQPLYYNQYTRLYSFNTEVLPINQARKAFTTGYFGPKELGQLFINSNTGKSAGRTTMQNLIREWVEEQNITIYFEPTRKKYTFSEETFKAGVDKKIERQAQEIKITTERKKSREYQNLRDRFKNNLESNNSQIKLNENAFNYIYDQWSDTFKKWQDLITDEDFNLSNMISNIIGKTETKAKREFRQNLREKVVNLILESPASERIVKLNEFLKATGREDSGTRGKLFTELRQTILKKIAKDNPKHPNSAIVPIENIDKLSQNLETGFSEQINQEAVKTGLPKPDKGYHYVDLGTKRNDSNDPRKRYILVQTKRQIDNFVEITGNSGDNSPGIGTYLVEDKAGRSFNLEQAKDYSTHIIRGEKGTINTRESVSGSTKQSAAKYDGIIYFFESRKYANSAIDKLKDLEAYRDGYIHVAFLNEDGIIEWSKNQSQNKQ